MSTTIFTRRIARSEAEDFFAAQERGSVLAPVIGLVAALDAACVVCMLLVA